jgi:uncharacterized protein with von Willebrand factor type A (vWA) domain
VHPRQAAARLGGRGADAQAGDALGPAGAQEGQQGRPEGRRGDGVGVAVITNIRHGLQLSRQFLGARDTPDRQVLLIADGLPTAHSEGGWPGLLYPPDPRTESATLREAQLCAREGITINIFLLASWDRTPEDVRFAYKVAESTRGRVFFTAGRQLGLYAVRG